MQYTLNQKDRDALAGLLSWWKKNRGRPQDFTRFTAGPKVTGAPSATGLFKAPEGGIPAAQGALMGNVECVLVTSEDDGYLVESENESETIWNWSKHVIADEGQRLVFAVKKPLEHGDKWLACSIDCDDETDEPVIDPLPITGGTSGRGGVSALPDMAKLTVSKLDPTVGQATSITLAVPRISGQARWFIFTGALPAGLTLDTAAGIISGTPTATDLQTVRFGVRADNGAAVSGAVTFAPVTADMALTALTDLTATIGTAHSDSVTASGGQEPYYYSITGHPSGISIDVITGTISGTPTDSNSAGSFSVVATATDDLGNTATASGTLVLSSAGSLTAAAPSNVLLVVGELYAESVTATGGATPYKLWSATGLPDELTINATSGEIIGIPVAGSDSVTVTVTDYDDDTDDVTFTLSDASSGGGGGGGGGPGGG